MNLKLIDSYDAVGMSAVLSAGSRTSNSMLEMNLLYPTSEITCGSSTAVKLIN